MLLKAHARLALAQCHRILQVPNLAHSHVYHHAITGIVCPAMFTTSSSKKGVKWHQSQNFIDDMASNKIEPRNPERRKAIAIPRAG